MKHRHSIKQKGFSMFVDWLQGAAPCVSPTENSASLHHTGADMMALSRLGLPSVVIPGPLTEDDSPPWTITSL